MTKEEDDEEEAMYQQFIANVAGSVAATSLMMFAAVDSSSDEDNTNKIDHRTLPRAPRTKFNHGEALYCIMRDYLGPTPLFWKNCPKAWQGSFKGKENKPTIVMEAICDYHLFFWHVSYGYAGTLNDKNVLHLSPFLEGLIDGSFKSLEAESKAVPYNILAEEFDKLFILVDGIYPQYARFVRGFKEPTTDMESRYTGWQEGARKDIERAFGVLQAKFQYITRPILQMNLKEIAARVSTCIIFSFL